MDGKGEGWERERGERESGAGELLEVCLQHHRAVQEVRVRVQGR